MKYLVVLLLIISFAGMGIFGFALFDMGPENGGNCLASAIDGTECSANIIDSAGHHISAVKTFTETIVPSSDGLLLLLAFLFLIFIFSFHKNLLYPKLEFFPQHLRNLIFNSFYSKQKIISWLSLLELSPAL